MPKERRDARFTLRLPRRLRDPLEREAERERRTVSDLIAIVLEDHPAKCTREGR